MKLLHAVFCKEFRALANFCLQLLRNAGQLRFDDLTVNSFFVLAISSKGGGEVRLFVGDVIDVR